MDTATLLRERAAEHGLIDVEVRPLSTRRTRSPGSATSGALDVIDQALRLGESQQDPLMRARTRARCMVRRIMARGLAGGGRGRVPESPGRDPPARNQRGRRVGYDRQCLGGADLHRLPQGVHRGRGIACRAEEGM